MSNASCPRFQEDLVGLLEGSASDSLRAHLATCDLCRDACHELEGVMSLVARAGDDHAYSPELAERLARITREGSAAISRADTEGLGEPRVREADAAAALAAASRPLAVASAMASAAGPPEGSAVRGASAASVSLAKRPKNRALWLAVAAFASVGLSAAVGFRLADRQRSSEHGGTRAWHGKVARIARSGVGTGGLSVVTPSGKTELAEGAEIKAGMLLSTDGRTRARLALDDGSSVVLDRSTSLSVESAVRTLKLEDGAILADVAHLDAASGARIATSAGEVRVLGTKVSVTVAGGRMNVEVLRGEVEVAVPGGAPQRVSAGQEGVVERDGRVDVAPVNDLAQRAAFGEQLIGTHNEDAEAPASGLGELRARRPGRSDEKDHAVHLAKHAVKIRIAGNVARTEIDEEFSNDTSDELEGIYRFPLPPGALIERLALEVDGKLVEGEFTDKAKAAAIWRGAIQNAAPKAPRPREELVWVPGPWHDPAILEWARGGRFELKVFPIPKRGSRRVVIAYTETVAPVSGVRRYTYPLPQGASSSLTIDQFTVDAQVVGHDAKAGVRSRGYELDRSAEGSAERLRGTMTAFTPSGDLGIEYGLEDRASDASVWAYASPALTAAPSSGKARDPDTVGSDPFVAIALRPKLPRWTEVTPRDQVIVVDAGRAMFGERFARAKLLSVQLAQEMDRRDRMTVLACDVTCTAMPGGFVGPGAPAAHDVDAFLAGLRPEGATDLVGAVRAAATVPGRDRARDLRVVLLSDGVATAGYRATGRLAAAVSEALNDGRAEVVAVPIGADADVTLLAEVARGGGGVVVPYQPGQRLEVSALEVLNATYGTTLRDVEVTLPPGLHDVAPASLPPLRAGSESIVTARLSGDVVRGDIVLRGKVGGLPFEARYPVDARASSDPGNAFVSRLFAGARIADRERDASDAGRVELVALSRRFSVPSRFTSLLVLESEAMFKAFGIERAERGAQWTGEAVAEGATVAALGRGDAHSLKGSDGDVAGADDLAASDFEERKKDAPGGLGAIGHGAGGGGTGEGFGSGSTRSRPAAAPRPAPTQAPEPSAAPPAKSEAIAEDKAAGPRDLGLAAIGRRRGPGQFMRKVFVRRATISADSTNAVPADKLALARAAVQAAPDERSKHKDLAKLLALAGQLDELGEALDRWSIRDPLDADVIFGRADLAARRGDRDASLRVLGGALAASAMSQDEAFALASTVARSYERLGRSEACAFRVTAAELRPADNDALARAIACERGQGRPTAAERWLSMLKAPQRVAVELAVAKVEPSKAEAAQGDVVIVATWGGGADLDVALVDPAGRRAGAATRVKGARVEGATARDHETLALATGETGSFLVEMVRSVVAGPEGRDAPVSGRLTIRAFGQTQTLPFVLVGSRVSVARLDTRWEAELVPLDEGLPPNLPREFDRAAAGAALGRISLAHCAASGQGGSGHAAVTFGPVGRVTNVVIDDARFAGTPAARCITSALFGAAVPPFAGPPVRVGKSFTLP